MSIQTVKKVKNIITDKIDEDYLALFYTSGQECSVPKDEGNRHYQAILEWVEDGNTIEDAD